MKKVGLKESTESDLEQWLKKSPEERVSAVEYLRRQYYGSTARFKELLALFNDHQVSYLMSHFVQGGKEAKSGEIAVIKKSGDREIIHKSKAYPLQSGDEIIVETGGGGGYGLPSERSPSLVERDVLRGYVFGRGRRTRIRNQTSAGSIAGASNPA